MAVLRLRSHRPAVRVGGGVSARQWPRYSDKEYASPPGEELPAPISIGRPGIPYRTPLEVAASTSENPDWLVRGYLALGAITELDGKIKSSGKTTLVTHLVASV